MVSSPYLQLFFNDDDLYIVRAYDLILFLHLC